jgi:GT2 family glycosyltransferase
LTPILNSNICSIGNVSNVDKRKCCGDESLELANFYTGTSNLNRSFEFNLKSPVPVWSSGSPRQNEVLGLSVIVLNLEAPDLLHQIYIGIEKAQNDFKESGYVLELIVGDTGSQEVEVLNLLDLIGEKYSVHRGLDYHFSKNNNYLTKYTKTSHLLFLNNDVLIYKNPRALWECFSTHLKVEQEVISSVNLLFPDLSIQHTGVDFSKKDGMENIPFHPHSHEYLEVVKGTVKYVPAVTGAFLMTSKMLFEKIEGFDEGYNKECQDIAYCLRARKIDVLSRVIEVGNLIHIENGTRPKNDYSNPDRKRFLRKFSSFIEGTLNA